MTDPERMAERIIDHLAAATTAAEPQGPTSTPPTAEELVKLIVSLRPPGRWPEMIVTTPDTLRKAREITNQSHRPDLATLRLAGIPVELADTEDAARTLARCLVIHGRRVMLLTQ